MRLFNSIQVTAIFAAMPFLIHWLHKAAFTGAGAAFWVSIVAYVVLFWLVVGCVYTATEKDWL